MKVYAAWSGPNQQAQWLLDSEMHPLRTLISFAYDRKRTFGERMQEHANLDDIDLMLDSGAFSVWTLGETIDLGAYIEWAQAYRDELAGHRCAVINLDVIPGALDGTAPTTRQRNAAVKKSQRNADVIRDAGLPVMEVFHLHEPLSVLATLLERRQPGELVGLGGLAGRGQSADKQAFCAAAFRLVKETHGGWQGIAPLHGLGIAPESPLGGRTFPWWSTDSSSWSVFHRYGDTVGRDGRATSRAEKGKRSITGFRPASDLFYIRTLRRWRRIEADLTRLWADRGVTFAADMEGAIA